jgi:hypothetical protein
MSMSMSMNMSSRSRSRCRTDSKSRSRDQDQNQGVRIRMFVISKCMKCRKEERQMIRKTVLLLVYGILGNVCI